MKQIGILGYGEVGRILAEDLRARGLQVSAYDLKLHSAEAPNLQSHALTIGVKLCADHAAVAQQSDLVISAVTASQTLAVAKAAAAAMLQGAFYLDFNSASPKAKQAAAASIDAAGGRYVEGAVMTSLPPYRSQVPLLLGGAHAADLLPQLNALGFAAKVASDQLGVASATKMSRSVMIKGLEAMVLESFTTARYYGVEDAVIASLVETFPGIDWEKQATYFFQRVIEHGKRRSEEMREVAHTVADAGLTPWSATATAERQAWAAEQGATGLFGDKQDKTFARSSDWRVEADRILGRQK